MGKNNNKIIKICIFSVIIIIVLVIIAIIVSKNIESEEASKNEEINVLNPTVDLQELQSISEYDSINKCVNKYTNYIKEKNSDAIYNILINDYEKNNDINKNNVLNKLQNINYENIYVSKKIYYIEAELGIRTYFIQGIICNKENKKTENMNLILNIDDSNNTFEIAPMEQEYLQYIDFENPKIDENKIKNIINNIEKNDFNKVELNTNLGEKNIIQFYFEQFNTNMIYDTQEAFKKLDTSYREKRFENYEQFANYIKQNQKDLEKSFIVQYIVKQFDTYKEYLCKDNFENYYIFKEKEPMNFTVMLDQYTINDRIFTEVYDKKENKEKAVLNLNKFAQMLNRGDYKKAYSVLNEKFKEKYFENEEKFEKYIKENLYRYNQFSYTDVEAENEKYKITTTVKNVQNSYKENTVKRFKVELLDNAEFSISFDM